VLKRSDRDAVLKSIHTLVEKAGEAGKAHDPHDNNITKCLIRQRMSESVPLISRPWPVLVLVVMASSHPLALTYYVEMALAGVVRPDWNGFNVIHESASRVAALDLGFQPSVAARSAPPAKVVYLLGADDYADAEVPASAFVVYQV
jgi:NADH dehydrogenase/NADH:ubiquinone oxidoreductase subunit G